MAAPIAHSAPRTVVDETATSAAPTKAGRGRPGKGERVAIVTKIDVAMGDDILAFAPPAFLTPGEYIVKLAAEQLGLLQFIPQPMMRSVERLPAPMIRNGFYTFKALPSKDFAAIIRANASESDLSMGNYLAHLAALALDRPNSAPQIPDQLDIIEEAAQTAA